MKIMYTPKQLEKKSLAFSKMARKEQEILKRRIEKKVEKTLETAVSSGKVTNLGGIILASSFASVRTIEMEYLQKYDWDVIYLPEESSSYSMTTRSESFSLEHYYHLKPKQ